MKTTAAVLRAFSSDRPYAASRPLTIEEIELDEPAQGEVLVRVASAGVCHSDLSTIEGVLGKPLPVALGDHVVFAFVPTCGRCGPCTSGRPALCELGNRANMNGTLLRDARRMHAGEESVSHHLGVSGFATYTVAAEESLVRIPDDVPMQVAALFGCAALTGLGAPDWDPDARGAVFGAGGVGLMAALAVGVVGASAIVIDPVALKRDTATSLGARATIDPSGGDAVKQIREHTGGRGADYVIEASGTVKAFEDAVAASAPGGVIVAVGLPRASARAEVSPMLLVVGDRTIRGSFMGSSVPQRDIPRYVELWRRGKLPIEKLVSGTIGLDGINAAMDALASGEALRTLVLPNGEQ